MGNPSEHTIETTVSAPRHLPRPVRIRFRYTQGAVARITFIGVEAHIGGTSSPKKWEEPAPEIREAASEWLFTNRHHARELAREERQTKSAA